MSGFLWPVGLYAVVLLLHLVVPARWVDGYVVDAVTGKPLRYRLNGLRVFAVVVALWVLVCWLGWLPWDLFYRLRWQMAAGACAIGLAFTFYIVGSAPRKEGASWLADFYLGRLENPQW